jgi:hypothetical protein
VRPTLDVATLEKKKHMPSFKSLAENLFVYFHARLGLFTPINDVNYRSKKVLFNILGTKRLNYFPVHQINFDNLFFMIQHHRIDKNTPKFV